MTDLRFDGSHLEPPRREMYDTAADDLFAACGSVTKVYEAAATVLPARPVPCPVLPPGVPYALFDFHTGRFFALRIGLTAIGRLAENDIVFEENVISRRHCAVLVHATGGCEVHDTASRNGTLVNGRRIDRAWLTPGDVLQLCHRKFAIAARACEDQPEDADDPVPIIVQAEEDSQTTEFRW